MGIDQLGPRVPAMSYLWAWQEWFRYDSLLAQGVDPKQAAQTINSNLYES